MKIKCRVSGRENMLQLESALAKNRVRRRHEERGGRFRSIGHPWLAKQIDRDMDSENTLNASAVWRADMPCHAITAKAGLQVAYGGGHLRRRSANGYQSAPRAPR